MKALLRSLLAFALSLVIAIGLPLGGIAQDAPESENSVAVQQADPIPVIVDGTTLLRVREGLGRFSSEERAQMLRRRVIEIARNGAISAESFEIVETNSAVVVQSNQLQEESEILRITAADAQAIGATQQQLAEEYLQSLKAVVTNYRRSRTVGYLLRSSIYSFITTLVFIVLLVAVGFLCTRLHRFLETWEPTRLPTIRIREIQLLTASRVTFVLIQLLKAVRFVLIVALILAYAALTLSFFPWTRQVASLLKGYSLSVLSNAWAAFEAYVPNLLTIFLIAIVTYYVLALIKPLFTEIRRGTLTIPGFYPEWASPTYRLVELLVFALAAVVVFPYLPGFGSEAFQGVGIFLGLLVSLGSSSAIANAVAGVILIYTRAFQVGDTIQVNDVEGEVEGKLFLVTRIRTFDNSVVTIPNGLLLSGNIVNYNAAIRETRTPIIVNQDLALGYQVPWARAYEILIEAALATDFILEEPIPFVHHVTLGSSCVTYRLHAYTRYPREIDQIRAGLLRNIHDQCCKAGVEILSPTYAAVRDGNASTLPEAFLPEGYVPSGFKVNPSGNLFQIDLKMGPNHRSRSDRAKANGSEPQ